MRTLSAAQLAQIERDNTRPIYLIEWQFDGTPEYLSTNGQIAYDAQTWLSVGASVVMDNWASATVSLPPIASRVTEVNNGTFRFQPAVIYYLPADPMAGVPITTDAGVPITNDLGEPIVMDDGFQEAIVLLDGIITGGRAGSSSLQMTITHRAINGVRSPRTRLSGPRAGTVVEWDGEIYTVEGRR